MADEKPISRNTVALFAACRAGTYWSAIADYSVVLVSDLAELLFSQAGRGLLLRLLCCSTRDVRHSDIDGKVLRSGDRDDEIQDCALRGLLYIHEVCFERVSIIPYLQPPKLWWL